MLYHDIKESERHLLVLLTASASAPPHSFLRQFFYFSSLVDTRFGIMCAEAFLQCIAWKVPDTVVGGV